LIIIGLTGSIGMGKSTAARTLRRLGAVVCDADALVHAMMRRGGAAVAPIGVVFPSAVRDGMIDRRVLATLVFGNPAALRRLEAIVHPLVREAQRSFLKTAARHRRAVAVLDIPLLFETGMDRAVDRTIVVSAPYRVQRARVLARSGMTEAIFRRVLSQQLPDVEKRRRADFVVPTGLGKICSYRALAVIFRKIKRLRGRNWPPRRRTGAVG
jgi:dephospho-CoA kinase